jgi:hypothetical protein
MALSLVAAVGQNDLSVGAAEAMPSPRSAVERLSELVDCIGEAVQSRPVADRLAEAGIVVRIDLHDAPGTSLTLLFDRTPPAAIVGTPPDWPSVRLWITLDDLEAIFREGTYLPMKIVSGEVRFEGTVRKLLRVMPILRRALAASQSSAA